MPKLFSTELTRAELQRRGDIAQFAGAMQFEYTDGPARGMRAIEVRNGSGLRFIISPDRGMDLGLSEYKGVPFAWTSKTGPVSPQLYQGYGFLRAFYGGLLTTCGITEMGAPGEDEGELLPLHGRISGYPASDVNVEQGWKDEKYIITVSGKVRQAMVLGECLVLTRKITVTAGDDTINIQDTIENLGYNPRPLMLLYHVNFGYPMLCEMTKFTTNCTLYGSRPMPDEEKCRYNQFEAPADNKPECVFFFKTCKKAMYRLESPQAGMWTQVSFDGEKLPYLIEWKNIASGEYVLGLEPATNTPDGRAKAKKDGELMFIEPQQKKTFDLNIQVGTL